MSTNFADRIYPRDTHANRPTATTLKNGTLYPCSTHGKVYRIQAGAWVDWIIEATTGQTWEGSWSAGTYNDGEIVEHNDVIYQANTTTTDEPPGSDWDVLYTAPVGGSDLPAYGVDWMRFPSRMGLVGGTVAAHVQNPLNVSDGDPSTSAASTSVTVPQDHRVDLGAARAVTSCYVAYSASGNRSDDGELQYSSDASAWTAATTWTNDATTTRLHTFSEVTARYWRVYTTQTGNPGGAGVNITDFRLINGGTDYAAGLTPTFNQTTNNGSNATDRNDTTSANQTNGTQPQWCRVDLGSAETVHAVRVMFASTYANIAGNAKVQWSSDDSSWNDIGDPALVVSQPEIRFDFAGQSARYWRVYTTAAYVSGNGLNWATFEVWGE